jgi:hypothetical protein
VVAPESRTTLGAYFLLCGIAEVIFLPGIHAVVSAFAASAETADFAVFVSLMAFTACALLYAGAGAKNVPLMSRKTQFWTGLVLLLVLLLSAATVTTLHPWEDVFWFGYGEKIAIIAVFALPLVNVLLDTNRRIVHVLLALITYAGALCFYVPSIVQPPWGLIDADHASYVLNEVLAPQAGGYSLVNFTAQYTSALGYVFALLFGWHGTMDHAVWFLTLLALAVVVFALAPLVRAFPKQKSYLAILFVVPAVFIVKANEDAYSGSIAGLFASLPVRLLFPAIIALMLAATVQRASNWRSSALLAFVCSLAVMNNFESGVVSTIAALMVLVFASRAQLRILVALRFLGLVVLWLGLDIAVMRLLYGAPSLKAMTAFVGGFGSGFGAFPMPTFGLWVFVFVFLSLGLITATLHFHFLNHTEEPPDDDRPWRLGAIVFFWSAFGIGMSPYYINRSVVPGQLQLILFPAFFAGAALLLLVRAYTGSTWRNMALIVASLPAAVSVASIVNHPSLTLAMERLNRPASLSQSYEPVVARVREKIAQIRATDANARIGLFTDSGFIMASALQVPSYLPVNHQEDLEVMGNSLDKQTCSFLLANKNDVLISNVPLNEFAIKMIGSCGYVQTDEFGSDSAGLIVLKRQ